MPSTLELRTKSDETRVAGGETQGRRHTFEAHATNSIFLTVLLVLGALTFMLTPPREMPLDNRLRAPLPQSPTNFDELRNFPRKFESYYNDRFVWRTEIISLRNLLAFAALHYSGSPKVLVGDQGWLEFADDGNLDSYLNKRTYTAAELESVGEEIEQRREWLAERGIRYLFLIVPDKATVYPCGMPPYYKPIAGPTRLDQLLAYLGKNTLVETVDLRSALNSSAGQRLLYWKTDTHWNPLGAYVAYRAISRKLKGWFPQMTEVRNVSFPDAPFSGDLSRRVGLQSLLVEISPSLDQTSQSRRPWHMSNRVPDLLDPTTTISKITATEVPQAQLPSLVLLHDSFMTLRKQPFLPANFRRSVNIWTDEFPLNMIALEKPDIVIEEHVERKLVLGVPSLTPALYGR